MANKSDRRAERLAAALRENLKRRKAKARQSSPQPAGPDAEKPRAPDQKPQ